MSADPDAEVYAANERFYEALTHFDLEEMEKLWVHEERVRCIHPGWDVLEGWESIRDAWEAIFASSPGLLVQAREVEVMVIGDVAWVHCLEVIRSRVESEAEASDDQASFARTTNLYRRTAEGWKMILHHASPVPGEPEEQEEGSIH